MRIAPPVVLSDGDRIVLERWARGRSTPARLVLRSRIALLAASGLLNREIARELRCGTKTVSLWRSRYADLGIAGIQKDAPRGAKRTEKAEALTRRIIEKTLHEPPVRRLRWSTRSLAAALDTSPAMIQRVWKAHGISPARRGSSSPS
jgi:transposase